MDTNFVVAMSPDAPQVIVVGANDTLVAATEVSATLLKTEESTVVASVEEATVIQAGQIGPRGQSAEDIDMHSKRVDFISDDLIYKGEAVPGTLPGWPKWRIHKLEISPDGDVVETWASGNALFDKVWNDRLNYEYL